MDHMSCHACKRSVIPEPPHSTRKILTAALWVMLLSGAFVASLIIGLNLVLAPAAIFVGMAIGTSARLASAWTCPCCKNELMVPADVAEASNTAHGHPFAAPATSTA